MLLELTSLNVMAAQHAQQYVCVCLSKMCVCVCVCDMRSQLADAKLNAEQYVCVSHMCVCMCISQVASAEHKLHRSV
jgi:hypothetical protein